MKKDTSNQLLQVLKQLRQVFWNIGLSGIEDLSNEAIDAVENEDTGLLDDIVLELERWNRNYTDSELENCKVPGMRVSTMIQFPNHTINAKYIHSISLCHGIGHSVKNDIEYSILLNKDLDERGIPSDIEIVRTKNKKERDEVYRSLKDKLRFCGVRFL